MAIVVRVPDSGLPEWQEAILAAVGAFIAFGILYGLYRLVRLPGDLRLRRRERAVAAAAGDDPVLGSAAVRTAAASLFTSVQAAWDMADRFTLARLAGDRLAEEWEHVLDGNRRSGLRYRVEVLDGPHVRHLGLIDEPGEERNRVLVRLRARLRCWLETGDGSRRALPEARGSETVEIEEDWTLARREHRWIVCSIRTVDRIAPYVPADPIVGPGLR